MLISWSQSRSGSPENSSQILSQFLRFNKYIKIEDTVIHFPKFSNKGINYISQLFENGSSISWINLKDRKYKILNNVLFLNKKLYTFGIINTALNSFCNTLEETPIHIFFDCIHVKFIRYRLRTKFQNDFILLSLTPQTATLGLYNETNNNDYLLNHILLVFKYYIYISRKKRTLNIDIIIANLIKVKKRRKQISIVTINKINFFLVLFVMFFL